jgi:hypothetical protein
MAKIDQPPVHDEQPRSRGASWKALWRKIKTPLQLLIGHLIGWALREWLG